MVQFHFNWKHVSAIAGLTRTSFAFRLYALRSHFSMTSRDAFTAIAKPIAGTVIASLAAGVAQVAVGVDLLSLTAFALAFLGAGWTLEPEVRILVARLFPRSMPS